MTLRSDCFIPFTVNVRQYSLPKYFTFPFYYQPHPLAVIAAEQLQSKLVEMHIFSGNQSEFTTKESEPVSGKMFGVLVVQTPQGELGFLSAYSGQANWKNTLVDFVPSISDVQESDEAFQAERCRINAINEQITLLESNKTFAEIATQLIKAKNDFQSQLSAQQALMSERKQQRKLQREQAIKQLSVSEYALLEASLAKQSIALKKQLQALKKSWNTKIIELEQQEFTFLDEIEQLKKQRRTRSKALQKQLFSHYCFLNANQETCDLNSIFAPLPEKTPPAGAGDCAAPKLLQYAYLHKLMPVVMAEFWWGASPKSAIRHHKHYYPSCYSKCQPILGHMLKGLSVEENPLLVNPAKDKHLTIIYQDNDLVVVNKPAEFLSVPGKNIEDSVYLRIKTQFPHATGPLIVHRLDMSTSGLLVVALNKRAHKSLQKQFIERKVEKRYMALVEGSLIAESGTIDLPLRLDLDDKPRQLVCYQHGKPALTSWKVVKKDKKQTLLYLYPKTGRTHQLRVHCAHHLGLNSPIVGDDHYGQKNNRLHLHAEYLAFAHPITKQSLAFQVAADF